MPTYKFLGKSKSFILEYISGSFPNLGSPKMNANQEIQLFYFSFQEFHFLLLPPTNFSSVSRIYQNHDLLSFITVISICPGRINSCSKKDWNLYLKTFNPWYTLYNLFLLMWILNFTFGNITPGTLVRGYLNCSWSLRMFEI